MKHRGAGTVNILVVEDDQHYRTYLCRALSRDGYNVRGTATGRDGVAVGSRFRPRVLVVNWMLGDDLNGLGVASVLQAVDGDLQTILITGFSLSDVADVVSKPPVFRIIEKPFELKELVDAVRQATLSQRPPGEGVSIGLVEVDRKGRIVSANSLARDSLGLTGAGRDVGSLSDLFSPDPVPDLDAAVKRWVAVSPNAKRGIRWQIRTQAPARPGRSRLVVIGRPDEMACDTLQLVETLLESGRPSP